MNHQHSGNMRYSRRGMLKLGAVATASAIGGGAVARSISGGALAPRAAIGFWSGSDLLGNVMQVSAASMGKCAGDGCKARTDDRVLDVAQLPSASGTYRVRVIGGTALGAIGGFRIDAEIGGASAGLWSAWRRGKQLFSASPVRAKWASTRGSQLRLSVNFDDGRADVVVMPAQRGVYVLALADAATGSLPDWSTLAMRAPDASRPLAVELVRRDFNVAVPHVLIAVEALAGKA